MDLVSKLTKFYPTQLSNGQVRMMCPFRENHTDGKGSDSMFLSPEIRAYHCFSCNAHGYLNKLLVDKIGLTPFEALEVLSEYAIESLTGGFETPKKEFEIENPWAIVPIPKYEEEGIPFEITKRFFVGIDDEGMMVVPYIFEGKIMAIQERRDFKNGERFLKNTPGFAKADYIYNYNPVAYDECTLVEGYTDVFRLESFEEHAVALWGVSFSDEQAQLMSAYKRIYVATDNDKAGRKALEVICYKMEKYGVETLPIPYLEEDPGKCSSRRAWMKAKRSATTYSEYTTLMSMLLGDDYLKMKQNALKNIS